MLENCALKRNEKYELTSTRQKLLDYAVTGNYKIDEEQIQKDVLIAFNSMNNNSSTARSVGQEVMLSKIQSEKYEVPQQLKAARSAAVESYEDIDFSVYEINSGNGKSFAITSNDRRIGEIIAIADGEFETDISENPFMQIVAAGLENHVNRTIEEWNSLTDEEVNEARAVSREEIATSGEWKFSGWSWNGGKILGGGGNPWNQESPYNDIICKLCPNAKVAGCGNVAMAQIFAYHEWPQRCSEKQYNEIIKKYIPELLNVQTYNIKPEDYWNGEYDWDLIKKGKMVPSGFSLNASNINGTDTGIVAGREYSYKLTERRAYDLQIAALMYDIAENYESTYNGSKGTSTSLYNAEKMLAHFEYECDPVSDYNFKGLKDSIDNNCPVPVRGDGYRRTETKTTKFLFWINTTTNYYYDNNDDKENVKTDAHAWLVSGYANLSCKASKGNQVVEINDNFLYCNPGWGPYNIGFYFEGIFDFRGMGADTHRPVDYATIDREHYYFIEEGGENRAVTKEYHENYYSFRLKMVTNIR